MFQINKCKSTAPIWLRLQYNILYLSYLLLSAWVTDIFNKNFDIDWIGIKGHDCLVCKFAMSLQNFLFKKKLGYVIISGCMLIWIDELFEVWIVYSFSRNCFWNISKVKCTWQREQKSGRSKEIMNSIYLFITLKLRLHTFSWLDLTWTHFFCINKRNINFMKQIG